MAKKKKIDLSGNENIRSNPFAGLAQLKDQLPEGTPDTPSRGASEGVAKQRVILRRQKKGRGGKTVTTIEGISRDDAFAKRVRAQLGTGAKWEEDELVVQGDQRDRLKELLESDGYPVTIGS
ncbi:MAG: translation initiation factor [Myxococcota bacterium]